MNRTLVPRANEHRHPSGSWFDHRMEAAPVESPAHVGDRGLCVQIGQHAQAVHENRVHAIDRAGFKTTLGSFPEDCGCPSIRRQPPTESSEVITLRLVGRQDEPQIGNHQAHLRQRRDEYLLVRWPRRTRYQNRPSLVTEDAHMGRSALDPRHTVPSRVDPRITGHRHAIVPHPEETESVAVLSGDRGDRSQAPKRGAQQDPARPTEPSGSLRHRPGNEYRRHTASRGFLGQGRPHLTLREHDHIRLNSVKDRPHHLGKVPRQVGKDVGRKIPAHRLGRWREERKDDLEPWHSPAKHIDDGPSLERFADRRCMYPDNRPIGEGRGGCSQPLVCITPAAKPARKLGPPFHHRRREGAKGPQHDSVQPLRKCHGRRCPSEMPLHKAAHGRPKAAHDLP